MTRKEVKSHEMQHALSVTQEMGLNQPSSSRGPVSVIELSVSCRFVSVIELFVSCRFVSVIELSVNCRFVFNLSVISM